MRRIAGRRAPRARHGRRTNASTTVQIAENLLRMTQFEKGTFSFSPDAPLPGQAVTFTASYADVAANHSLADCYLYALQNPQAPMR